MQLNTDSRTAIPCPAWCTTDHTDMPPGAGFHAGDSLAAVSPMRFRLWQTDQDGAPQGVVVGGELLTDADAHELGLALCRAADVLRRARMEAAQ